MKGIQPLVHSRYTVPVGAENSYGVCGPGVPSPIYVSRARYYQIVLSLARCVGSAVPNTRRWFRVVLSFLYWTFRRLLEALALRLRSERSKEIEILVLRHQLHVLSASAGGGE